MNINILISLELHCQTYDKSNMFQTGITYLKQGHICVVYIIYAK
jgi:hypothetical protein